MSVARHGPSELQVPRLIAAVVSASVPAGPERATLAMRSPSPAAPAAPISQMRPAGSNHRRVVSSHCGSAVDDPSRHRAVAEGVARLDASRYLKAIIPNAAASQEDA